MNKQEERDEEFWKMTDDFIKLANEKCDSHRNGKVSTTMLFAVARFNAFLFASTTKNLDEFKKERNLAIEYFTGQYQQAFIDNLNYYDKNYNDYVGKPKEQ